MYKFNVYLLIAPQRTYRHGKILFSIEPISKEEMQLKTWRLFQRNLNFVSISLVSEEKNSLLLSCPGLETELT